jgi:hypothetical protein
MTDLVVKRLDDFSAEDIRHGVDVLFRSHLFQVIYFLVLRFN